MKIQKKLSTLDYPSKIQRVLNVLFQLPIRFDEIIYNAQNDEKSLEKLRRTFYILSKMIVQYCSSRSNVVEVISRLKKLAREGNNILFDTILLKEAVFSSNRGKYKSAIVSYIEYKNYINTDIYRILGFHYEKKFDFDRAYDYFLKGLEYAKNDNDKANSYFNLAKCTINNININGLGAANGKLESIKLMLTIAEENLSYCLFFNSNFSKIFFNDVLRQIVEIKSLYKID